MSKPKKAKKPPAKNVAIGGAHAILGMDIVSFSKLHDEDQILAIECILRWIREALAYHSVGERDYRWSPAGDGGYLTFASQSACRNAIDVGFSIAQKTHRPDWRPRSGDKLELRFALHTGTIQEAREFGKTTNIWGMGINLAARILSVAAPSQLLVSKQYFDTYIKGQREKEFHFGEVHWRTVKHGMQVEVMNANHHDVCLQDDQARDRRWQAVGGLWRKIVQEYSFLIGDTMRSGDPIAALAAGKFLLNLNEAAPVWELCRMVGQVEERPALAYPPQTLPIFSLMPPEVLFRLIDSATPRLVPAGTTMCERGDPAETCFFPVSGRVEVVVPGLDKPIRIPFGQPVGEFSLWVPNARRTACIRVVEDSLVLEFQIDQFRQILSEAPRVAETVYLLVRTRILDNVLKSKRLFPGDQPASLGASVTCEKHAKGTLLELTSSAHILFSGKVKLCLPDKRTVTVAAPGEFGAEEVIGIVSDIGTLDGSEATVVEEAVAVKVSHQKLRELQKTEAMANAWNALYGQRQGTIARARNGGGPRLRVVGEESLP